MKLALISGIIMFTILTAGIFTDASISKLCEKTEIDMENVILLAQDGDLNEAVTLINQNIKKWQDQRIFFSVLQHHDMYDCLYSALMRAKQYAVFENGALLAGESAAIIGILDDIKSSDTLNLENIF